MCSRHANQWDWSRNACCAVHVRVKRNENDKSGGFVGGLVGGAGGTVVAPGVGTLGVGAAGVGVGSQLGGAAAGNAAGNAICPEECKPPVGTRCYEGPDTTHAHGGLKLHYHIFQMLKFDGKCQ